MSLFAPELTYDVQNWAPGFLDSPDASQMPKGSTPSAANCLWTSLTPDGNCTLSKRTGAALVTPSCLSVDKRIDNLFEFSREGFASQLLAVCDGALKKWDGVNTFPLIANLGMASGSLVQFMAFRRLVLIMNGALQKCYDGLTVFGVGFAAPTAAPGLATTAPIGGGVTGTYESLATWYDSTHDHESSPSAQSGGVVFAAQARRHTKPAGAPPANVDKWRVYVRRNDTNEQYFKLAAEIPIGTVTFDEEKTDSARNLASNLLAPLPNANDVPPVFAFAEEALGYRFGVQKDDSFVWVSALNDPQSQHPKDKIAVAAGDGYAVTTVKPIGKDTILVQKARKSWTLTGDRMPFVPKGLDGSLGNHSQTSSVEAAGKYWAWDAERGPYVTDLATSWDSLVDGRIARVVSTVNVNAEIRCGHFKKGGLIIWLVATGASTRSTTMLAYNYIVKSWLPPIYGVEYAALTTFKDASGAVNLYIGDQWGRVFQYFVGDVEGVPDGTLTAQVTAADANSVTAADAAFYTDGDGLKGLPVGVVDAYGNWQIRTIASNTGTQINLDIANGPGWATVPDNTYQVVVGGIDWFWSSPLINWGAPMRRKQGRYVYAQARAVSASGAGLIVRARLDDENNVLTVSETFAIRSAGGWGSGLWGVMLWGGAARQTGRKRLTRSFYGIQFELSNRFPQQPMELTCFGVTADGKKGRWAHA